MITCQITSKHLRYDQRIFKKIAVSLAKKGNCVSYIVCNDNGPNECVDGVHIVSIKRQNFGRLLNNLFAWKKYKKAALLINADVYQLHDPDLLPLALFLKRKGKIVIFDSHENYENISEKKWIPKIFRNLVKRRYLKIESKVLKRIDGVVTVTDFIQKRLSKINKNCIILSNFPILKNEKEHKFRNFDFCFGGNFGSYEHLNFIKCLENFNGKVKYNLVINCFDNEFEALTKTKGIQHVNLIRGPLPYEKLEEIYEKSAIGMVLLKYSINYNYKEGSFGVIKIFEMMSKGIPVICTDFTLWKEIINLYKCGIYVNPENETEIKSAISQFLNNPKLLKIYGENARRAVEEKFNWQLEEKKLYTFYDKIYKGGRKI